VNDPLYTCWIVCPAGSVAPTVQPLIVLVPVFVTFRIACRPPCHELSTVHDTAASDVPDVVVVVVVGRDDDEVLVVVGREVVVVVVEREVVVVVVLVGVPPTALMMALTMPCWVTVPELRLNSPNPYTPL